MKRNFIPILFVLCVVICSCKDNVVCPAFQSTYILDDSIRWQKYSYFANDTTPKFAVLASRRTKYGINKKTSLFRKNYEMKTAPKVNVLTPLPEEDTVTFEDVGEFLASDFVDTDSLGTDSLAVGTLLAKAEEPEGPKYKYRYGRNSSYNQEQQYYNKYYGELFIDNRPPKPEINLEEEVVADSTSVGKKRFGLFKKKKSEPVETNVEDNEEEESPVDIPEENSPDPEDNTPIPDDEDN